MKNRIDIEYILSNVEKIKDKQLKENIYNLVNERNYLMRLVRIDTLTGAYNRRILKNISDYSVVVLCDIDNFKEINDQYGHDTGDVVLKTLSRILIDNSGVNDVVCRYGGDEFLIIYCDQGVELVKNRMNVINNIISNSINLPELKISFSAGISKYKQSNSLNETIKEADIALYEAKSNGKHGISCYEKNKKMIK